MDIQKLLIYTKEELATYILKHYYPNEDIEEDMKDIHCQLLLEKDTELTNKEHEEEMKLLQQLQEMPNTTLKEQIKVKKLYEKFKKLCNENTVAYEKRQKEIDKLLKDRNDQS